MCTPEKFNCSGWGFGSDLQRRFAQYRRGLHHRFRTRQVRDVRSASRNLIRTANAAGGSGQCVLYHHQLRRGKRVSILESIGKYKILAELGTGSMGVVYRARDRVLDRQVAVKVLRAEPGVQPELFERFQREARACARLQHPNIVTVYDLGCRGDGLHSHGTAGGNRLEASHPDETSVFRFDQTRDDGASLLGSRACSRHGHRASRYQAQ